ncbi:hypothetical protein ACFQX7_03160 [Luedemannella flava]
MTTATDTGLRPPGEVPPAPPRPTRKPLRPWDRIKFLVLFIVLKLALIWAAMADNPLLPFVDAVREQWSQYIWWYVLVGVELLRQTHYLISERSAAYHHFWTHRIFGGFERTTHRRFSDWTRFGSRGSSNGPSGSRSSRLSPARFSRPRPFSRSSRRRRSSGRCCRSSSR